MSELIPDFYTEAERALIERWRNEVPVLPSSRDFSDSNAVADLVLAPLRHELPRASFKNSEGQIVTSRELPLRLVKLREPHIQPKLLSTINWADTAPGVSWPESYYLTALPGYDGFVVTASQDSTEMFGVEDEAIDFIPETDAERALERAKFSIQAWWAGQREGWEQEEWEAIWDEGLLDGDDLSELASQVWSVCEVDEDL